MLIKTDVSPQCSKDLQFLQILKKKRTPKCPFFRLAGIGKSFRISFSKLPELPQVRAPCAKKRTQTPKRPGSFRLAGKGKSIVISS